MALIYYWGHKLPKWPSLWGHKLPKTPTESLWAPLAVDKGTYQSENRKSFSITKLGPNCHIFVNNKKQHVVTDQALPAQVGHAHHQEPVPDHRQHLMSHEYIRSGQLSGIDHKQGLLLHDSGIVLVHTQEQVDQHPYSGIQAILREHCVTAKYPPPA